MHIMAAISEYLSSQREISVTGRHAGAGGRPGALEVSSSIDTSDISTNSKSRIRFTTFGGSVAAGLKGPGWVTAVGTRVVPWGGAVGVLFVDTEAAAASKSRPLAASVAGVNDGSVGRTAGIGAADTD